MYTIGIDIGSMSANGVLLNEKKEILSSIIIPTGASSKKRQIKLLIRYLQNTNYPNGILIMLLLRVWAREGAVCQ